MDPNKLLAEILHMIYEGRSNTYDRKDLIYLLETLKDWISKGGFLPTMEVVLKHYNWYNSVSDQQKENV